jgi:hypothetical protein
MPTASKAESPNINADLTNVLVAEWKQFPVAMFQHLVERVEAVIAAKAGPSPY